MRPAEPEYYGIDGLFLTIEEELAQLQTATPFGQAKGTKAVLRFTPDPQLGYPRSYRRDVLGTPQVLAIDVTRFDPPTRRGGARSPRVRVPGSVGTDPGKPSRPCEHMQDQDRQWEPPRGAV